MSNEPPKYFYVASPGGEEGESPCKIGVSNDPTRRIFEIRSNTNHSYEKELGLVRIYECDGDNLSTQATEHRYRSMFWEHSLEGKLDWFDLKAGVLIGELDNDERCSAVSPEQIGS